MRRVAREAGTALESAGRALDAGKPVVAIGGIGLNNDKHPPADPDAALHLLRWFQTEAQVT